MINFDEILDAVIKDYGYDELTEKNNNSLLTEEEIKDAIKSINNYLEHLEQKGIYLKTFEQDNVFKHISVNRDFEPGSNKFRLYLSPKDKNVFYIIYELIRKSVNENKKIYLKFASIDRIDKLVIYLKNKEDLDDKIKMLLEIEKEYPNLFENMDKSVSWISSTKVKGVYMAPEKLIKRKNNIEYKSYTQIFSSILSEIRSILVYSLGNVNLTNEELGSMVLV